MEVTEEESEQPTSPGRLLTDKLEGLVEGR